MALIPPNLDYTDKDFDALRVRLQGLIRQVFTDWTDFNVATFGNMLLELFCFVGDVVGFYQDSQSRESRIISATQRKNLLALAKLLNFTPTSARAATAEEKFSLPAPPVGQVIIPAGTLVRTPEVTSAVRFQLLHAVTIPAGADPPEVTGDVENSESFLDVFQSPELANYEITLARTPYLDYSARVAAGNGLYAQRSNFLDSTSSDRHFTITVDQSGKATIRFGNGVNGAIPRGTVTAFYKTGGGARGNVLAGTIVKLEGSFTDEFGTPVALSCTNPEPASGGADRMTMAQIKLLAPESVRTAGRTVSREDYEINARQLAGVARALMLTSNEAPMEENTGKLFVIPQGGGMPTSTLKDDVLAQVTTAYPHTITFHVEVMDPLYLTVAIQATVYLKAGQTAATVKARILENLADWFAISNDDGTPNENVDFGFNYKGADGLPAGEIAWSDIFNVIRDTTGVRKVDESATGLLLNGARSDLAIGVSQFPILGTVTLFNGDTGLPL